MKKSIFFLCLIFHQCYAQDPYFVQAHNNAMYLNPALTGCFIKPVISVSGRLQWPQLTGTYTTMSASYHQLVRLIHGGIGAYYMHDDAGDGTLMMDRVNLSYALHLEIGEELTVRIGGSGGYVKRTADWNKLTFGDMIDPRYGFVYPTTEVRPRSSITFWDFGAGFVIYTEKLYLGGAIDHLNEPDESFISQASGGKLPAKIMVNPGCNIRLGDAASLFSINPDLIYTKQKNFSQTVISVTAKLKYFLLGSGYRSNDGIIFSLGGEGKFFRIMYSYDRVISRLANSFGDSHELFISFRLYKIKPSKGKWTPINMVAF